MWSGHFCPLVLWLCRQAGRSARSTQAALAERVNHFQVLSEMDVESRAIPSDTWRLCRQALATHGSWQRGHLDVTWIL